MLFDEAAVRAGDGTRLFYRSPERVPRRCCSFTGGAEADLERSGIERCSISIQQDYGWSWPIYVVTVGRITPATVLPPSASLKTCSKWPTEWSVAPDGRFLLATPVSAMPTLMVTLLVDWPALVH